MSVRLAKWLHRFLPSGVWPPTVLESPLLPMVMPRGLRGCLGSWELLLPFVVPVVYGLALFVPGWDYWKQLTLVVLGFLLVPFFFSVFVGISTGLHVRKAISKIQLEQLLVTRVRHGDVVRVLTFLPAAASRLAIQLQCLFTISGGIALMPAEPTVGTLQILFMVLVLSVGMLVFIRKVSDKIVLSSAYQHLTIKESASAHFRSVLPGGIHLVLGIGVPTIIVAANSDIGLYLGFPSLVIFLAWHCAERIPSALLILEHLHHHPSEWWVHAEE